MGWSIGGPDQHGRFVGYGVPAFCDHPKCTAQIDRGLAYVCCNQEPYGGDRGCGLYFCEKHSTGFEGRCMRCARSRPTPYTITKPEHPVWLKHLINDESWADWRREDPDRLEALLEKFAASFAWCEKHGIAIKYDEEGELTVASSPQSAVSGVLPARGEP